MRFDVERYLQRNALGFRRSGAKELVGKCWACGKPDHLYINRFTGNWHCFAGSCEASGTLASAIMRIQSVTLAEARRIVANEQLPYIPGLKDELRERLEAVGEPEVERVAVDLPPEFKPCWDGKCWRVPVYLRERGVTKEQLARFGVGFCRGGRYAGRVVFPVRSPWGYSFTTRLATPGMLRYLSGPEAGKLLFGWQESLPHHSTTLPVVLVEGPFDCLAVDRAGFPSLALLGKELRHTQRAQLRALGAAGRRFVLLLDRDAVKSLVKQMGKLRNLRVALLPGAKDPAVAGDTAIRKAVRGAIDRMGVVGVGLRTRLAECR